MCENDKRVDSVAHLNILVFHTVSLRILCFLSEFSAISSRFSPFSAPLTPTIRVWFPIAALAPPLLIFNYFSDFRFFPYFVYLAPRRHTSWPISAFWIVLIIMWKQRIMEAARREKEREKKERWKEVTKRLVNKWVKLSSWKCAPLTIRK